jgi:F-box protein 11
MIEKNKNAGIKTTDFASVVIANNEISGNYGQGILLVESTYAHIEKNIIKMNYKANIAFGGDQSCDTIILNNEISEGRAEGIFGIETGFAWIFRNKIFNNSDGIVLFDSTTYISENQINEN